jgi:hypothetical protein
MGKSIGKLRRGRLRRRENNMELDLKEIGHECDSDLGRTQVRVQWRAFNIIDVIWILIPRNNKQL